MLTLGNHALAIAVIAVGIGFGVNVMLGPQCAMLPEMFGNRHRYLGVAMARARSRWCSPADSRACSSPT